VTTPYGVGVIPGSGSMTHRGEQLYERVVDNTFEFFGVGLDKDK
jgi:hypothetical protein